MGLSNKAAVPPSRMSILNRNTDILLQGKPMEGTTRTIPVHGVVAGAAERIPVMSFTYRIKGGLFHATVCKQATA